MEPVDRKISKTMADLARAPEDAYKRFICVETGNVSWNTLGMGDNWVGGRMIKAHSEKGEGVDVGKRLKALG